MNKWLKRLLFAVIFVFVLVNVMVIFQAYHFTHFYTGIPKPKRSEEMSVAEKTAAIFFGIKIPKSKVVDSLQVAHTKVALYTEDGLTLEAWENAAVTDSSGIWGFKKKGTVILFHGHGSCKSALIRESEAFYKLGYNILMVDFRAHGNSEGNVCTIGMEEAKDVKAAYDYIQHKGEKNIILYGISLGASTELHAIAQYHLKPAKLILEMPFGSLYDAVKGKIRMMKLPEQPLAALLTFWGGTEHLFWAFNMKPAEDARFVNCPVLLQWGLNDNRVTVNETNQIYKNLGSHNKLLMKYVLSGHESLLKKEPVKWIKTVGDFLN